MLSFDGQVAVITGAGRGLGAAYARELARRGARVVVNDNGTSVSGDDRSPVPAEQVAGEINEAGGIAVATTDSVADAAGGRAVIDAAMEAFGRIDILIHNAGIGRAKWFAEVSTADIEPVLAVHLIGAFHVIAPAWERFVAQESGSIITTTSAVGVFGQRRSSVYAAAKMGVIGLTRTLAQEGTPHNIRVNAIAPVAASRMAGEVYQHLTPMVPPERVAAAVVALAHPDCAVSGEVISAGGGRISRLVFGANQGYFSPELTAEEAAVELPRVCGDSELIAVPGCAMDEVDLIRREYPELADQPMRAR
ncbi:SDR family NAD(P)-dependent oxidoreductase [Micromonospora sp. DR5-3]|uniref:SDR family NAD(P)-dependent oxidoreductase n=1 Tax=unclassified Micromonospora TaxID=2617518 RepID=UPI0011D439CC|nr:MULTISPECIES: SDR family NAD(P)-dependent oxidoreductase [unclassified Micromonospora]MCW3817963.1 SDR family NAD(P)-dependent oxidoreductase [Micromonospora sp. DR5-3]TYC21418.1 SDR family NAD(P)-dependent oxidoreductase [Micromonospora sp. MP36]